jgi:hypothetical protein
MTHFCSFKQDLADDERMHEMKYPIFQKPYLTDSRSEFKNRSCLNAKFLMKLECRPSIVLDNSQNSTEEHHRICR